MGNKTKLSAEQVAKLDEAQRDGRACVHCGRDDGALVPIGHLDDCLVFEHRECGSSESQRAPEAALDWTRAHQLVRDALAMGADLSGLAGDCEGLNDALKARYGRDARFDEAEHLIQAARVLTEVGPSLAFGDEGETKRAAGGLLVEAVATMEATCADLDAPATPDFARLAREAFRVGFEIVEPALLAMGAVRRAREQRRAGKATTLARTA